MNRTFALSIISVGCVLSQYPLLSELMTWDRQLITNGEWWRILTGNFTHTKYPHLLMNLAALWLIGLMFQASGRALLLAVGIISIAIGFQLFYTDIQRYVGLSGTLHGLFIYLSLIEAMTIKRSSWILVLLGALKVGWEYQFGGSQLSSELINAPIATEAHLAGAIAGVVLAVPIIIIKKHNN